MTDPVDRGPAPTPPDALPDAVANEADPEPEPRSARAVLGLFAFRMEGRAAPGLFVAGWIAILVGASAAFVGLLAGRTLPGVLLFFGGIGVVLVGLILLAGAQAIERRRAELAYAGPSPVLVMAAVIAGWYVSAVAVVTPLNLLRLTIDTPVLNLIGVAVQAAVMVGLLRLLVVGQGALTWREMGWTPPGRRALAELAWGAIFAVPVIVVTSLVLLVLVAIVGQQPASPLPPTGSTPGLLLNLVTGALIAPIYEELFFRGFALTAWRRMGGAGQAIVRSAVLFALIHAIDQTGSTFGEAVGAAVVAVAARLPVALLLGWVFNRRRSLWASIGLHATFNAILLILAERATG